MSEGVELIIAGLAVEGDRVTLDRTEVTVPEDVRALLDRLGSDASIVTAFLQDVADVAVWLGASDAVALVRGATDEPAYRRRRAGFREPK